jgi:hypothetical protein
MTKESNVNPAEKRPSVNANTRLHQVLTNLARASGNSPLGMLMPTILGIHTPDGPLGASRSAAVMYKMVEAAGREIEYYLPDELEFYLPEIAKVRTAISPLLYAHGWDAIKGKLTEGSITHIRHTGQRLKKLAPELELWPNELATILTSIDELREMVERLELDEAAKHKLRQRCNSLRTAVEEYRFWGVEQIEVCFESTQAAMVPFVKREGPNGELSATWKKIGVAIVCISSILGNANSVVKNVHESFTLLESGAKVASEHSGALLREIEGTGRTPDERLPRRK